MSKYHPTYESSFNGSNSSARPAAEWLRSGVMYQLFTRMFTAEGTFDAARKRLPKLKKLGVSVIYLTPHQLSDDGSDRHFWSYGQKASGMNNPQNPYRQKDFFAVDPEYGTEDDLKAFVDEAHRLGIKVLFDLVYFHCGPNAVFLEDHPDYVVRNEDGTPMLGEWAFPQMDIANPSVREYLYSNMTGFIEKYDVDGFRCDVADMLPVEFWEEGYRRCTRLKPDIVLMCEGLKADDQLKAFDLSYGFYTQWSLRDMLAGKAPADMLRRVWEKERKDFPKGFHWMRCFENHDFANLKPGEERKEKLFGNTLNSTMLATLFLLDGMPMLYNGQEIADASPHSIFSNREHGAMHIDWTRENDGVAKERKALVRKLCRLRHRYPELFDAPLVWLDSPEPEKIYAFKRILNGGKELLFAANISKEPVRVVLDGAAYEIAPQGFVIGAH